MSGGTGTGFAMTTDNLAVTKEIIGYIKSELVDGDVRSSDNLGEVLRRSSIGFQGAALGLAGFLEREYGVPLDEARKYNPDNFDINDVAITVGNYLAANPRGGEQYGR